ncbi:MAG: NADH-quinone oxidoreductase subunit NuoE [Candidatus Rifleibacteriota bacterium]
MLASERDQIKSEINKMAKKYNYHRSGLIPVLQHVQNLARHISPESMQDIAAAFNIHPVEVQGVVSFYSFLSTEKKGKFILRLCRTVTCDMAGKEAVANQLENELGIEFGETTPDGMFTLEFTNCLGMCDQGPALLVNDEIHTRVTPEKVADILDIYRNRFGAHVIQQGEH